jgi:hypothetical protein
MLTGVTHLKSPLCESLERTLRGMVEGRTDRDYFSIQWISNKNNKQGYFGHPLQTTECPDEPVNHRSSLNYRDYAAFL